VSLFHKYKKSLDESDLVTEYAGVITLPSHSTYENDTTCARGLTFNVSLTSAPIDTATMTFMVEPENYRGGRRIEGQLGWNGTSPATSVIALEWSISMFQHEFTVTVCTVNEYVDDDDTTYYINGSMSSSDTLYNSSARGATARFKFRNIDDDTSGTVLEHNARVCLPDHSFTKVCCSRKSRSATMCTRNPLKPTHLIM
jgi:hypothetical protein